MVVVLSAQAGPRRRPGNGPGGRRPGPGRDQNQGQGQGRNNSDQWIAKLCANSSTAQSFLNQTQQLIGVLQLNSSFAGALQRQTQQITYIQSADNAALLSSNCTGFFSGLKAARQRDWKAGKQQQQYQQIVRRLLENIIRSLTGTSATGKSY